MELLIACIQPDLLCVRQVQKRLAVERGAEIGFPVTDHFTFIKPIDEISFQTGIYIKIICFLKCAPCANVSV